MIRHRTSHRGVAWGAALLATVVTLGSAGAEEGPSPDPIPRTKDLAHYIALVEAELPPFPSGLLNVSNGPDWMAGMTVHRVATAVLDSDPGTIVVHGPVTLGYDPPDGPRRIRLDFAEGYIRYTNRQRGFGVTSPCVAVADAEAQSAMLSTVAALGLPSAEWGERRVDTVMDRAVDGEGQDPAPEQTCEIERTVTMRRQASNGLPILDSKVRETVSNLHERARLLVDWPRFVLAGGLAMRPRAEVVQQMAERIWEAQRDESGLGAEIRLRIEIGYARGLEGHVPVAKGVFVDIYDRFAGQVLYVPLAANPTSGAGPEQVVAEIQFRARVDRGADAAMLEFFVPDPQPVRLTIHDVAGREVARLADGPVSAGWHRLSWSLGGGGDRRVASGVYFARLLAGREAPVRKLIVVP